MGVVAMFPCASPSPFPQSGLYQLTAALAGHFVSQPADPSFYYSCLGASAAAVALAGLQIRSSFTVDPERCACVLVCLFNTNKHVVCMLYEFVKDEGGLIVQRRCQARGMIREGRPVICSVGTFEAET